MITISRYLLETFAEDRSEYDEGGIIPATRSDTDRTLTIEAESIGLLIDYLFAIAEEIAPYTDTYVPRATLLAILEGIEADEGGTGYAFPNVTVTG